MRDAGLEGVTRAAAEDRVHGTALIAPVFRFGG